MERVVSLDRRGDLLERTPDAHLRGVGGDRLDRVLPGGRIADARLLDLGDLADQQRFAAAHVEHLERHRPQRHTELARQVVEERLGARPEASADHDRDHFAHVAFGSV